MKPPSSPHTDTFVCPWWLIRSFDNPLRRLVQPPEPILKDLVRPGERCLDVGCGIGYFTIPMARLVGSAGTVVAVDLQTKMLEGVKRRASKHGLESRVVTRKATVSGLGVRGPFDFVLAFWMMHEVPDQQALLMELHGLLNVRGRFLIAEPKIHVNSVSFNRTVELAEKVGFDRVSEPKIFFSWSVVMEKVGLQAA
jgi:2-polyprenyl-3-methyl-5-hydroxy-6-metoxy-1,4-benzoquinol methylase